MHADHIQRQLHIQHHTAVSHMTDGTAYTGRARPRLITSHALALVGLIIAVQRLRKSSASAWRPALS